MNAAFEKQQRTGEFNEEFRITRPDGSIRWIYDRAFPIRDPKGEVYRLVGIAEDITERKRAEDALRMQAGVLENMAEGVSLFDEHGVIEFTNPAFSSTSTRPMGGYGGGRCVVLTIIRRSGSTRFIPTTASGFGR